MMIQLIILSIALIGNSIVDADRCCGEREFGDFGYFLSTGQAHQGEFPWKVAIMRNSTIEPELLGGGALIHSKVVLTAAYKVFREQSLGLIIRIGALNIRDDHEAYYKHQNCEIERITVHKDYKLTGIINNYALIILKKEVNFDANVNVVCLPESGRSFNGSRCIATGWGKDISGKEDPIMKQIELPVVARRSCETRLRRTELGQHFILHDSFMCAGGEEGKDTCNGDGGGPLVCLDDNGRYVQAGFVVGGLGCGGGTPALYGDVANARPWIDEQMTLLNLGTSEYQYQP